MTPILLTGAGFTRNWGGWLAKEIEGDLLGRLHADPDLRQRVQGGDGFEEVLATLKSEAEGPDAEAKRRYADLQKAVEASFRAMNRALANRIEFNFSNDRRYSVNAFLARFDAIYTLNQDLLLELHYDPTLESPRRWNAKHFPGIASAPNRSSFKIDQIDQKRKVLANIVGAPGCQPIYKLHGSTDWQDDSGDLFVIGGGKESYIERKPLLVAYFADLAQRLRQPGVRLMIIGYGFGDKHVNDLLSAAAQENRSLGVFFVHPDGRDAIHGGVTERVLPQWTPPLGYLPCIGESRRPLWSTFRDDELEFEKLMRFFA
jgi:hypothetical protein